VECGNWIDLFVKDCKKTAGLSLFGKEGVRYAAAYSIYSDNSPKSLLIWWYSFIVVPLGIITDYQI
jgi:hypothetical protein